MPLKKLLAVRAGGGLPVKEGAEGVRAVSRGIYGISGGLGGYGLLLAGMDDGGVFLV